MKEMIKDFLNLFANSILIICLMLTAFLLLINVYHYQEVNYVYASDMNNNEQYQEVKTNIEKIETNMNKVNSDIVSDSNRRMTLKIAEGQLKKCLSTIRESDFYNFSKTSYTISDLYFLNSEFLNNIQHQCLFLVNYNIYNSIEEYNVSASNYNVIREYVESTESSVTKYADYINNELLENSSYHYTTQVTRDTVFNKVGTTANLIIYNYGNMIEAIDEMARWYVVEAGGNYE